ncbi:MAG: ATPase domain-containing protein [Nanoarchaeota archaeon]|nr:KaiC domain-containing protein [Nanoarchaeota archaeon]MBU4300863.1 KaiC domain-containing protein [Nanoarchaeota archaeon]MBU4451431.1 KaiC domain-containing protein [Nanoarchaeota archaeon]MCG2724495.1 KaiC domain-containing protein [archaeon]
MSKKNISKLSNMSRASIRVSTGIIGLDKMLLGGFPSGSCILITGGAGTGKTTLMLQFIWEGLKNGENCIYITLEEPIEDLRADAMQFGWDLMKYEKTGQLRIEIYDPFELTDINLRLKDLITTNNYRRVAIDSTSLFGMYIKDEYKIRKGLFSLVSAIKSSNCTAVLSSEITEDSKLLSRYGVEEFVVDGVIVLRYLAMGSTVNRTLEVRKMRRTSTSEGIKSIEMTSKGIVVV